MANPNIVNVTSIFGKTTNSALTTTTTSVLDNPTGLDRILKINSILVANIDGLEPADVTVSYGTTSSNLPIASTITVPNDSTLVVLSKDTSIYVEEGAEIFASASSNNRLVITISYEEIIS
jgi:hypothetical protein